MNHFHLSKAIETSTGSRKTSCSSSLSIEAGLPFLCASAHRLRPLLPTLTLAKRSRSRKSSASRASPSLAVPPSAGEPSSPWSLHLSQDTGSQPERRTLGAQMQPHHSPKFLSLYGSSTCVLRCVSHKMGHSTSMCLQEGTGLAVEGTFITWQCVCAL